MADFNAKQIKQIDGKDIYKILLLLLLLDLERAQMHEPEIRNLESFECSSKYTVHNVRVVFSNSEDINKNSGC